MSRSSHLAHTWVKFLFVVIIAFLILFSIFVLYKPSTKTTPLPPSLPSLSIQNLRCQETSNRFIICGTVLWSGPADSYVTVHLPGGTDVDQNVHYTQRSFDYCNSIEKNDGFRILQASLYDVAGNSLDTIGQGVECTTTQRPSPSLPPPPSAYTYQTTTQFTATLDRTSRAEGSGSFVIPFPDPVLSCNATGSFFIDDGAKRAGAYKGSIQRYCQGATGSFTSFADQQTQTVTVDPALFIWNSITKTNPPSQTYPSFIYAPTCDTKYSTDHRYYVRGTATGFTTNTLIINWYYKNDDTKPEVDFTLSLDCLLRG